MSDLLSPSKPQVDSHVFWARAKSFIAVLDPSNHGLLPALSGNHPFVPPTARERMR